MELIIGRTVNYSGTFLRSFSGFNKPKTLSKLRCLCQCIDNKTNNRIYDFRQKTILSQFNYPVSSSFNILNRVLHISSNDKLSFAAFSNKATKDERKNGDDIVPKKVGLFQKMKQLGKDYWHILIPVHIVTSIGWVSIFYTAAKNGVDVISLMEYIHMPDKYIDMIRNSKAGDFAVTYALYKVFTPLRYTVTIGGTTMSIKYLDKRGYLKFKRQSTEAPQSRTSSNVSKEKTSKT